MGEYRPQIETEMPLNNSALQSGKTLDEIQVDQPILTDTQRDTAREVLTGTPPTSPDDLQRPETELDPLEKPDASKVPATTEVIDWETLTDEQKTEHFLDQLRGLGFPEDEIQKMPEILSEARLFLSENTSTVVTPDVNQTKLEVKNKNAFTVRQLAAYGMFAMLDVAVNHGHGTRHMFSEISNHYLKYKVMPNFLSKLGFDNETIDDFLKPGIEPGRGLFQMDRPSLVSFLSNMSKTEAYDVLDSLDIEERNLLLNEGRFGTRSTVLYPDEIKRFFLDRLSDTQKQRLKIETKS